MIKIEIIVQPEDDINIYSAIVSRGGLIGHGSSYIPSTAKQRAENDLVKQEKNLNPESVNWENTIEARLCQ